MSRSLYVVEGHSAKALGEKVTIPPEASGEMMHGQMQGVSDAYLPGKSAVSPTEEVESYDVSHKSRIECLAASSAAPSEQAVDSKF